MPELYELLMRELEEHSKRMDRIQGDLARQGGSRDDRLATLERQGAAHERALEVLAERVATQTEAFRAARNAMYGLATAVLAAAIIVVILGR